MKEVRFRHEVVTFIPETLQANTLYVTTDGDVAGHLCACGCGREVITPLSPMDWSITFDRCGATLSPSIGNWAFPCRSHYFIWDGTLVWAGDMSDKDIAQGRRRAKANKQMYYERLNEPKPTLHAGAPDYSLRRQRSAWERLVDWWRRRFGSR